ncbi:MAG: hypothetical protein STHCBS139747_005931 [Sporothrix thermara]
MARRAGVTPFSLTATTIEGSSSSHQHRRSPSQLPYQQHPQAHAHHHSQGGFRTDTGSIGGSSSGSGMPSPRYGRGGNPSIPLPSPPQPPPPPPPPPMSMHESRLGTGLGIGRSSTSSGRGLGSSGGRERGSTPGRGAYSFSGGPSDPANAMYHYNQHTSRSQQHPQVGFGLPPIQTSGGPPPPLPQQERLGGGSVLPSLAEITTGVSPYSTPAYSLAPSSAPSTFKMDNPGAGSSMGFSAYPTSYGPESPSLTGAAGKRRASPIVEPRDHRRRYH